MTDDTRPTWVTPTEVGNDLSFRTAKPVYADSDDRKWLFSRGVKAELDETEATEEGQ